MEHGTAAGNVFVKLFQLDDSLQEIRQVTLSPVFFLQQCMSPSFVPLRCEAGQCGRLLTDEDSCSPQCFQLTQCSQCISRPQCGWCSSRGGNGAGRCLQGGLNGTFLYVFLQIWLVNHVKIDDTQFITI